MERCWSGPDVLYHFHGVPSVVVDQVERAGLHIVARVINEGTLSDDYTRAWARPGAFARLMNDTRRRIEMYCEHGVHIDRVALSSFSAGFAAVQQILSDGRAARRIDGVLLEDSLYAGYSDPQRKVLSPKGLSPFLSFARASVEGDKLMAITHSEIRTPAYASTRETADYLLRELGLVRKPPSSGKGTEASDGNFWLRGLPGRDAAAHARHLQHMGETVLVRLAQFW